MVRLALRNPYAVIVMALAILIFGVTALGRIPTDLLPIFKTPAVQILTFYPGMLAEIVEKDITTRLERWTGPAKRLMQESGEGTRAHTAAHNWIFWRDTLTNGSINWMKGYKR